MNKGKKMSPELYEKLKPTMFVKGQECNNKRPIGSERINVDGYIEIKTAEPNVWDLKHRVVWEREHNVKLTSNQAIIFRDGNKLNCEISNLLMCSRSELLFVNQHDVYNKGTLTETGILTSRLLSAVKNNK